jgi:phage repressor protein C with HTH and peptisase S24 domain
MSGGCQTPTIDDDGCSGGESFALRVLGDDMAPEFNHGDIVIIEPDGAIGDGCFVLARDGDGWLLRQLRRRGEGWVLHALNDPRGDAPDRPLPDLQAVRGVVIQKAVPGRRRLTKFYV